MGKIKAVAVLATILALAVFHNGSGYMAVAEQHHEAITLEWAKEQGYLNSQDKLKLDMDMARLQLELDKLRSDPNLNLPWNAAKLEQLRERNRQEQRLLRSFVTTEAKAMAVIEDTYYNLLFYQQQVETQEKAFGVLQEKYGREVQRLRLGLSTEIAVETLALSLLQGRLNLQKAQDNLQQMEMQFNLSVGRDLFSPVFLQQELLFEPEEINFVESLQRALSAELGVLRDARIAYEEARDAYRQLYSPEADPHGTGAKLEAVIKARLNFEQAEAEYNHLEKSLTISMWSKHRDVLAAEETVRIAARELDLERLKLDVEERKASAGLSSSAAVVEQFNRVVSKEMDYSSKVFAYNRTLRNFRMAEQGL